MKKVFALLLVAFICQCWLPINAYTRYSHIQIELLGRKNGLKNNSISTIFQDKEGFLWLGTDVGISRYDGVNFHNFNLMDSEPYKIQSLFQTDDNLIWGWAENLQKIACINIYNHQQMTVKGINENTLKGITQFCIVNNHLYALKDSIIVEMKVSKDENTVVLTDSPLSVTKTPIKVFSEKRHLIIVTAEKKVLVYSPQTKKTETIDASDIFNTNESLIENIRYYNDNLLFYGSHSGAFGFNLKTKQWKQFSNEPYSDILVLDPKTFVVATWNELKIVGWPNEYNLKFEDRETLWEIKKSSAFLSMMQNRINSLYYDKFNYILWVGTSGGLIKINFKSALFNSTKYDPSIKQINGLAQDAFGYIWLSTRHGGVYKSTTNELNEDMTFSPWKESNPQKCYALHQDRLGNLWFGDSEGVIIKHNPNNNTTEHIQVTGGKVPQKIGHINHIYMNSRNRLWIASDLGMIVYNSENGQIMDYIPNLPERGKTTAICEDGSGTMWIGFEKGVFKVTTHNDKYSTFEGGYEKSVGLTPNKVYALYRNSYNQLYASYSDKIIQIDGKTQKVSTHKVLLTSLTSGDVACMIDDRRGNTWLGTKSGIITIHNASMESYLFELPQSFYKVIHLNNNQLLWAHSNGLTYFNPDELKYRVDSHKLHISDIEINYRMINSDSEQHKLGTLLHNEERLVLDNDENNIKVFVTDLRYKDITSKLEYRLLPNDTIWTASYDNFVQLNDLKPGDYTLEIRPPLLTGNKGNITELNFTIKNHWSTNGWAIMGYCLLFAAMGLGAHLFVKIRVSKLRHIREKEMIKLEESKLAKEQAKAVQQQMDFRKLLAKEMFTPLSLIVGPLKEALNSSEIPSSIDEKIKLAHRNALGLQGICNQLMKNHSENSMKQTKLQVAAYPASDLADEVMRSFYELLQSKVVKVFYNREKKVDTEIWTDRKRMNFILYTVMSNAFRHTNYSGNVWFNILNSKIGGVPYCLFCIEDNGKEYAPKTEVCDITDENFKDAENILLGWDLIKKDILSHGWKMKISRKADEGTQITICIPLGKEHLENNPNVEFIQAEKIESNENTPILTTNENAEQIEEVKTEEVVQQQAAEEEKPESKLKLLIIEDNADIRLYLKVMFTKTYQVLMASNGEEGIRIANQEIPNLIITDIGMPVMDGFECCRLLKENLKTCHIPIIILTAMAGDENIVKGTELGADDYILKPFNPEILRSKVKSLIKGRSELKKAYTKFLTSTTINEKKADNAQEEEKDPLIQKIIEIVEKNLQNPDFSVNMLADLLGLSQTTLYRRVKQMTGYTIVELVRGVRIKKAAELLEEKKYSIQEVAEMVGYNDTSTFRKHFTNQYGTTPSNYNKE